MQREKAKQKKRKTSLKYVRQFYHGRCSKGIKISTPLASLRAYLIFFRLIEFALFIKKLIHLAEGDDLEL